jgi:lysophospholipase L1-like esterase
MWAAGLLILLALIALCASLALQWLKQSRRDAWLNSELMGRAQPAAHSRPCDDDLGGTTAAPLKLLILGQSNAGNHGPQPPRQALLPRWVQVQHGSQCLWTQDPLPGASGDGRSIWSRLPQALQQQGLMRTPQLAVMAVQSTTIEDWSRPSSPLNRALQQELHALKAAGWAPDLVLWQQGEADALAGTTSTNYQHAWQRLLTQLQNAGIQAPVLLARSTHCEFDPKASAASRRAGEGPVAIRAALLALSKAHAQLRLGPDTDTLTDISLRRDGCHFSGAGQEAAAQLWAESIAEALKH